MKVFISWSGEISKEIAKLLKDFIPKVIQSVRPYYTPDDIEKGKNWNTEINKSLEECVIGLICLTKDNKDKPWILFEAGALSNRLDNSKVCPILFDDMKPSDIEGPLSTFQLTQFTKNDFLKLIQSINLSLEESIKESDLEEIFNAFFPKLEEDIQNILNKNKDKETGGKKTERVRTDRQILEEILLLIRSQSRKQNYLEEELRYSSLLRKTIDGIEESQTHKDDFSIGDMVYIKRYKKTGIIKDIRNDRVLLNTLDEYGKPDRLITVTKLEIDKIL